MQIGNITELKPQLAELEATSWLFISVAEDLNSDDREQIQQVAIARDSNPGPPYRIASPRRWPHAANRVRVTGVLLYIYSELPRFLKCICRVR